jgi:hypothetical protein
VGSLQAINEHPYGGVEVTGVIGMEVANGVWSDFLLQFFVKFVEIGLAAIAVYFWLYGVYWYSLWRGAVGHSIANALGWILFITIVSFVFFLWIGVTLFMLPLAAASRFLFSSPFLILLYISGSSSLLMAFYFSRLAKRAKRSLRGFLIVSPPLVHGMKARRVVSFR